MSHVIFVGKQGTKDGIVCYDVADGTFTEISRLSLSPFLRAIGLVFTPDGSTCYSVGEDGGPANLISFSYANGQLSNLEDTGIVLAESGFALTANGSIDISSDGSRLVTNYSGTIRIIDISGSPTVTQTKATSKDVRDVKFCGANDEFILAPTGNDNSLDLYDSDLTLVETLSASPYNARIARVPKSNTVFAENASLAAFSVSPGGFSAPLSTAGDISSGSIIYLPVLARLVGSDASEAWDGSAFSDTVSTGLGPNPLLAANPEGTRVVSAKPFNISGAAQLFETGTWTQLDSVADSELNNEWNGVAFAPNVGPLTPEELFQASYADASAAPPKITALISPADVQRSIDTDVSNLVGGPDFYTVEAIFGIGELSDVRQDKLYFVKDDQPGLRDGKLLRLKRYQIRNGDPAVPVTCTFWG